MEISGWMIYLISIADGLGGALLALTIITGILGVICFIIRGAADENLKPNEKASLNKWIRTCLFFFILTLFGTVLVPSGRALAAIYVIPKIVNNETLQDEAGEIYKYAKEWLKSTLEDNKEVVENTVKERK